MGMKEIDNAYITKANATRSSVYTMHKYLPTNTSNTFEIKQQEQACRVDKYGNTSLKAVAIEFSKGENANFLL